MNESTTTLSRRQPHRWLICSPLVLLLAIACTDSVTPAPVTAPEKPDVGAAPGPTPPALPPSAEDLARAEELAEQAATERRQQAAAMTFEEFEASVFKEPFPDGKYIVNGDTTIASRKRLQEFYESLMRASGPESTAEFAAKLVVHQEGGQDSVWNDQDKLHLSYCVSEQFASRYDLVVTQMAAAAAAWEAVSDINFIHAASQDARCDASNDVVVFDVRPVDVDGEYLARAFFPHETRPTRNVLIDDSAFQLDPQDTLTLVGILRHELGHTLGFRHEHTRPDAGQCFEDDEWRPLTSYDPFSVMHYPQCNGLGDWSLTLTHEDEQGTACLYGPSPGFTIDTAICPIAGDDVGGCPATMVTETGEVEREERRQFGPYAVTPGTRFEAVMTGTGDPDLYVNYDREPSFSRYVCRPYLPGPDESCELDVPGDVQEVFLMVRGFAQGTFSVDVTFTRGAP